MLRAMQLDIGNNIQLLQSGDSTQSLEKTTQPKPHYRKVLSPTCCKYSTAQILKAWTVSRTQTQNAYLFLDNLAYGKDPVVRSHGDQNQNTSPRTGWTSSSSVKKAAIQLLWFLQLSSLTPKPQILSPKS